jgi:putative nucleotidyltransferase with HDIG domain
LLSDEKADMSLVSGAIKNDPAIVLRVLKVANSPFYGFAGKVDSLEEAVALIGLEAVVNMVAVHRLFQASTPPPNSRLDFEQLWQHSAQVAGFCRLLAPKLRLPTAALRESITGALLHDMGKLILAVASPESYSLALARMRSERIPSWQSEYEVFGNHHAEVGACLLNLWGLPKSVVSAVAFHHTPHRIDDTVPGPATLIHVADLLAHQGAVDSLSLQLDGVHLKNLSLPERLSDWMALLPCNR